MPLPILTALILVLIIWLNYEMGKTSREAKNNLEHYWSREKASNSSRRVDISTLPYIIISIDELPTTDHPDPTINSYRDILLDLSGKKALNLSGRTNTELKLEYGVANIKTLIEYDNNYTTLVSILHKWADRLYTQGSFDSAISVLEYAVQCQTDVPKSYILLAKLYRQNNDYDKITDLIQIVPLIKVGDPNKLIKDLSYIKNT